MSAEARAKIAASQRARWARLRGGASAKSAAKPVAKQGGHRTHSEATRQKIALAAKARWARIKGKK